MKAFQLRVFMAVAMAFSLLAIAPAHAIVEPTLSLQATSEGNTTTTQFQQGQDIFLNILVDDATGIAGVAFTLTYDATVVTPPAINAEGLPDTAGDITTIFPFSFTKTDPDTDTFRANGATSGKIYLSGAAIDETTGGAKNTAGADAALFTIKFKVKTDAVIGANFTFGLEQTMLCNFAAGYGTDNDSSGTCTAGDTYDPVPVLVGAVPNTDTTNFNDLALAFPVLKASLTSFGSSTLEVVDTPKYTVSGTIAYDGAQTGDIIVGVFNNSDFAPANLVAGTTISAPGPFTMTDAVPEGTGYYLAAFRDSDAGSNLAAQPPVLDVDATEAQGEAASTFNVTTSGASGLSVTLADPDDNADGIPDYWAALYSGIGAAGDDFDHDGYTNLQEFQNGTDPTVVDTCGEGCNPSLIPFEVQLHAQGADIDGTNPRDYYATIGTAVSVLTEEAPPSAPPNSTIEMVLFQPPYSAFGTKYLKDLRALGEESYRWIVKIDPNGVYDTDAPLDATLSWDPANFNPEGSYQLREGTDGTGSVVVSDMRTTTAYTFNGGAPEYFTIEFGFSVNVDITLSAGWNMVSIPVVPDDGALSAIFPEATVAYKFEGFYQSVQTLEPGIGYWVKVPAGKTYTIVGQDFNTYTKTLAAGWHMVGAVNGTATPATTPAGEITVMYGFTTYYQSVTEFVSGKGYWVKLANGADFTVALP